MIRSGISKVEKFSRVLKRELAVEEVNKIKKTAEELNEKIGFPNNETRQGLLFGQVQSGKTNNMLMTIAQASDNGHRLFIILTSDNLWLYDQTLERVQEALPGLLTLGKDSWGIESMTSRIQTALNHNGGVVLVTTKNKKILPKMQEFIKEHIPRNTRSVIFDDEADQASLNTFANTEVQDKLSEVSAAIVNLRDFFNNHVYVQVTATPQALLLQGANKEFRPDFIVKFSPGAGYIGGEAFFEEGAVALKTFPDSEIDDIMNEESDIAPHTKGLAIPTGLRQALCTFFIGASIKICNGEGTNYTFLCHVSHKQDDHRRLETMVNGFITSLSKALHEENHETEKNIVYTYLNEAYQDLLQTNSRTPSFELVIAELADNITSTQSQLIISGSHFKKPRYSSPFNILIGGNKLGRGVTVKRLLVTYYGRSSQAPKVDTILQHARMYGYRERDLGVLRFFTSYSIAEIFTEAYLSEKRLRTVINKADSSDLQALVLSRTKHSLLRPTRSNVIYLDSVLFYMSGKRYFPRNPLVSNVGLLDHLLEDYKDEQGLEMITIQRLIEIVNLTKSKNIEGGSWDDEAILACLKNMKEMYNNRGYIAVRRNRDIKKNARTMLSSDDNLLFNPDGPTLIMYKYTGSANKGWSDDKPLWVPNLRFPDGNTYFMFSTNDIPND